MRHRQIIIEPRLGGYVRHITQPEIQHRPFPFKLEPSRLGGWGRLALVTLGLPGLYTLGWSVKVLLGWTEYAGTLAEYTFVPLAGAFAGVIALAVFTGVIMLLWDILGNLRSWISQGFERDEQERAFILQQKNEKVEAAGQLSTPETSGELSFPSAIRKD